MCQHYKAVTVVSCAFQRTSQTSVLTGSTLAYGTHYAVVVVDDVARSGIKEGVDGVASSELFAICSTLHVVDAHSRRSRLIRTFFVWVCSYGVELVLVLMSLLAFSLFLAFRVMYHI